MKNTRKLLAVLLSVLLLCAMLPAAAISAETVNLVQNGDFEGASLSPWVAYEYSWYKTTSALSTAQSHGGSQSLQVQGMQDHVGLYQTIAVEANTDYTLSFYYISTDAAGDSHYLYVAAGDFGEKLGGVTLSRSSTEWTKEVMTFNSGSATSVTLYFQGHWNECKTGMTNVYVDDITILAQEVNNEVPDAPDDPPAAVNNLFANGDFETGDGSGWKLYQSTQVDATAAKDGGYGLHIVGNGGWGGLGNQTITGLEIGKTYRISLDYKAISNGVNIQLCEGTSDAGAKLAYIYGTKAEWTQFAVEFEATTDTVFFTLVGAGNNIATEMYMDNVSLTEVVLGGNDDDPNLKMIDTLMDHVKTQGRTALVGGTLMLDFTVSGIEFELDCAGDVYATFNARKISNSSDEGGVYFTIYVDGKPWARNYCRIASVGETKVLLASNLSAGKHTFAIYRQSEHSYGEVGVCALSFDGEMLEKPADKDLYLEFIGDSISCGFGNLGNNAQGDGSALWSDGTQAYTFLTAQALNADWSTVSWSGLGCKYGYSSTTMQDVYPAQRYNYDKTTLYDFSKQPDVVILALGTNDNSMGPNATSIRAGLKEMLALVRAKNPNAPIVWIHNMMTDGVSSMIEEIVAEEGGADAGYYACRLTRNTSGGGSHPNLVGQQTFADELVAFLQENGLTESTPDEPDAPSADVISGGETSRSEDVNGLAFRFDIAVDGMAMKNGNWTDYTNATVDALGDGTPCKLIEMGAVLTNDTAVGTKSGKLTLDNLSDRTMQIKADRLFDLKDGVASYAVRVINIPAEYEAVVIYARAYYIVEIDGEQYTVYDEIYSDNYIGEIDFNDGVLEW